MTKKSATIEDPPIKTGELTIDFNKKRSRFSWIHVVILVISLYVFLFLPIAWFVVNVLPGREKDKPVTTAPAINSQNRK